MRKFGPFYDIKAPLRERYLCAVRVYGVTQEQVLRPLRGHQDDGNNEI